MTRSRGVSTPASGLLSPKVGGPSVFPPQPDGVYKFTQIDKGWKASAGDGVAGGEDGFGQAEAGDDG